MKFEDYNFAGFMKDRGIRQRSVQEIRDAAFNLSLVINSMACEFHDDRHADAKLRDELGDAWSALWKTYTAMKDKMLPMVIENVEA